VRSLNGGGLVEGEIKTKVNLEGSLSPDYKTIFGEPICLRLSDKG